MAQQKKSVLKQYFQTGDIPTSAHYGDVIDSFVSLTGSFPHDVANEGNVTISGSIFIKGEVAHITASGNVSASGTGSFGHVVATSYTGDGSQLSNLPTISQSIFQYTSSMNAFSASVKLQTASLLTHTASVVADIAAIKTVTSSLQAEVTKIKLATASLEASDVAIKQQSQSLLLYTASNNAEIASIKTKTGSLQAEVDALKAQTHSLLALTASDNALVTQLNVQSASLIAEDTAIKLQTASLLTHTASINASIVSFKLETSSLHTHTGSVNAKLTSLNLQTASLLTKTASLIAEDTSLKAFTASIKLQTASLLTKTASLEASDAAIKAQTASLLIFTASGYTTASSLTASGLVSAQTMSIANGATPSGVSLSTMGNISASGTITASGILIQGQALGSSFLQVNDTIGAIALATTQSVNHNATIPGGYNAMMLTDNSGDITIELGKSLTNSGSIRLPYLLDAHNGSASMQGVLHILGDEGMVKARSGSFEYLDIANFTNFTGSTISASNTLSALSASIGTSISNTTNPSFTETIALNPGQDGATPLYVHGNLSASNYGFFRRVVVKENISSSETVEATQGKFGTAATDHMFIGTVGSVPAIGHELTVSNYTIASTVDYTQVNTGGNEGIRFSKDNTEFARFSNAGRLGIGTTLPNYHLDVRGHVAFNHNSFFGRDEASRHTFTGSITSSGPISASGGTSSFTDVETSGKVTANEFRSNGIISASGDLFTLGNTSFGDEDSDTHTFEGHVTASGNISASGIISAKTISAVGINSSINHLTASSATGSFTGSFQGVFDADQFEALFAHSASINAQTASLLSYTSSNNSNISSLNSHTASANAELTSLKAKTASLVAEDTALKTVTASLLARIAALNDVTASLIEEDTALKAQTASLLTFTASGYQTLASASIGGVALSNTTNPSGTALYVHGNISASSTVNAKDVKIADKLSSVTASIGTSGLPTNTTNLAGTSLYVHGKISASGDLSAVNISASGDISTDGFISSNGFGSSTAIATNTTVPADFNVVLFTSNYNQSITINAGTNYTISVGADVRLVNMSNIGNIPQTFYN